MRPTVDEQLGGIDRLLELIAADSALGDESALLLRDARRQLGRLRASLPARLRFLRWDNEASAGVLVEVAAVLPVEFQTAIAELAETSGTTGDDSSHSPEQAEAELNDRLRKLLARAIDALPQTAEGEAARLRIIKHLRDRVDANPALNKNPIIPEESS